MLIHVPAQRCTRPVMFNQSIHFNTLCFISVIPEYLHVYTFNNWPVFTPSFNKSKRNLSNPAYYYKSYYNIVTVGHNTWPQFPFPGYCIWYSADELVSVPLTASHFTCRVCVAVTVYSGTSGLVAVHVTTRPSSSAVVRIRALATVAFWSRVGWREGWRGGEWERGEIE